MFLSKQSNENALLRSGDIVEAYEKLLVKAAGLYKINKK